LRIGIDFPDYYKTWYRPAYQTASKILQKEKVDLIYSASPTFITAFVAMELKREFGIPWVADFLDGWAVNDFLNLHYDQTLIKPLRWFQTRRIRRAEGRILETANKVVVIHQHVKQRWYELYGIKESKIEVVTDGYDESVFEGLTARVLNPDRLTITFLGSYYAPFEDAIRKFLNVVYEIDKDAEVAFIGRAATAVQKMNIPNLVCILQLPREKALSFALGSDFLFVVMPPYAKWTPTKTYDYLRLGKPVLALVPEGGDAARIIREARAGFVLSFDQEQMRQQLKNIFDGWRKGKLKSFQPDRKYITQFERRNLTKEIVKVFNEVLL
jgi:glycosyltransferase involved in cell wall biosynthesis